MNGWKPFSFSPATLESKPAPTMTLTRISLIYDIISWTLTLWLVPQFVMVD